MMPLSDADICARFGNSRPGRRLVAIEHGAVPVTAMRVLVSAQEEKPLPLLEEFVLRSVDAGLRDVKSIAPILGLDPDNLSEAVVSQVMAGHLAYDDVTGGLGLTARGVNTAKEMISIAPVELEIPVCFDRAIWRAVEYNEGDLISRNDALTRGMLLLPALRSQHVQRDDLRLEDLEQLVGTGRHRARKLQILSIVRAGATKHRYLPVRLLIFAGGAADQAEILTLVEGEESFSHAQRVAELGGSSAFRVRLRRDQPTGAALPRPRVGDLTTIIGAIDHPAHLTDALLSASRRLTISTSSLRRSIVGPQFRNLLEQRLRDGVRVRIVFDSLMPERVDRPPYDDLQSIARRFRNFSTHELPGAPGVLVYDDTVVISTFDWLGYRGGEPRVYFSGDGELTRSAHYADTVEQHIGALLSSAEV